MEAKESGKSRKWYYKLARVILFYICSIAVLIFTSIFTKNVSAKIADQLSILCATILTFILVLIFTHWEKLKLKDVGIIPGAAGTAIASGLVYFLGWLVGWVVAGFRQQRL